MLSELTSAQFEEWRRYDRAHPIGDFRSEVEAARLISFIAQMMGNEGATIDKYLWSWAPPAPKTDRSAEIKRSERELLKAFGIR